MNKLCDNIKEFESNLTNYLEFDAFCLGGTEKGEGRVGWLVDN